MKEMVEERKEWLRKPPPPSPTLPASPPLLNPDFASLDESERKYLPYSFVVSELEQWEYLYNACASGFTQVANLSKVNNANIQIVADVAALAIRKRVLDDANLNINHAFIRYATRRGV
jgi:hypothetical protein